MEEGIEPKLRLNFVGLKTFTGDHLIQQHLYCELMHFSLLLDVFAKYTE